MSQRHHQYIEELPYAEVFMHIGVAGEPAYLTEVDRYVNGQTIPPSERISVRVVVPSECARAGFRTHACTKSEAGWVDGAPNVEPVVVTYNTDGWEGPGTYVRDSMGDLSGPYNDLTDARNDYAPAITDGEVAEMIAGYVGAATWTDLERPPECPDCGRYLTPDDREDAWTCESESCARDVVLTSEIEDQLSSGANRGSDPYAYGPDDLEPDSLARVREIVEGFCGANRADLQEYALVRSYDPKQGSVWEYVGHDLYLSAVGHGTGFWDRGADDELPYAPSAGRVGDRLHAAAKSGYGLESIQLGADGTITVQG